MIRVVLVDDFAMVRMVLREALTLFMPVEITGEAGNGQEAVELCQEINPDVVILDYALPDMDGLTTAQKILEVCSSAKIIILSTSPMKSQDWNKPPIYAWLPKSGSLDDLIQTIQAAHSSADKNQIQ